jgi:very-short-patch-repair endonuclease
MLPAGKARLFASRTRRRCKRSAGRLWSRLRRKQLEGFRFRHQHPLGPYVVDFFCAEAKLIVEVDGGQHSDDNDTRTRWLESRGCRVIRFWNNDVLANTEGVQHMILDALRAAPHPSLPLKGDHREPVARHSPFRSGPLCLRSCRKA